jgi:hypothetical protein
VTVLDPATNLGTTPDPRPAANPVDPAGTTDPAAGHLLPLPGTRWRVWRDLLVRSTGFPVDGLDRFTAPEAARIADAHLAGDATAEEFAAAFERAAVAGLLDARDIARDPLFREAVTWQGRTVLHAIDGAAAADEHTRRSSKQRQREIAVLRYWQRYCTKNESIGFFGPVCWATFAEGGPLLTAEPGPALTRAREVTLEHWALAALGDALGERLDLRLDFPVSLHPHFALRGREVLRPTQPPVPLSPAETAVLSRCDGRRTARQVAADVLAAGVDGPRKPDDVLVMLGVLADRGLVRWDVDLPIGYAAETVLRQRFQAVPDEAARAAALAGLDRVGAARDAVAAAAGDDAALRAALAFLDTEFSAVTGRDAARRQGEMYAARTVCAEDTARDVRLTFAPEVLAPLARPLDVLLRAADWVTAEIADAYDRAFADLYRDLAADFGPEVPLGQLWFLAQGLIFGTDRPADGVGDRLTERWNDLFGLAGADPAARRIELTVDALADRVAAVFPDRRPGWRAARLHAPDLILCAGSVEEVRRGEYFAVLGELHAASATMESAFMVRFHPDPAALTAALTADTAPGRILPLYPVSWPRLCTRLSSALRPPGAPQLGIDAAPGADPDRLWPLAATTVRESGGKLVVAGPDGSEWPLIEAFAEMLWVYALDSFKLVAPAPHTPRISLDKLVVVRETWRTTVGGTGLAGITGEPELYLAARAWRAGLGLPDRVFVKVATETKPVYVDLTSPQHLSSLRRVLTAARTEAGDEVSVVITELLPGPEHAWLPDARGRRYSSELRLHLRGPRAADPAYDDADTAAEAARG